MTLPAGEPGFIARCPACGVDWLHRVRGETYSRLIGVEIQGRYDGVSEWECPDCGARWDRWTREPIPPANGPETAQSAQRA